MLILPVYYNSRFFTAYQYLEERFSVQVRTLASASFIVRVLLWLAATTYAPALALKQATGMPLWFTILPTGLLTTFYTTFGGMRAVIWTEGGCNSSCSRAGSSSLCSSPSGGCPAESPVPSRSAGKAAGSTSA